MRSDVAPGDVGNTVFDVGTLGGSDQLWAQLLQDNGQLTGGSAFTVTAPWHGRGRLRCRILLEHRPGSPSRSRPL
jgi:hypothetical protein